MNKSSTSVTRRAARISTAIALAWVAAVNRSCRQGDRGRLIGYEKVGAYATPEDARAHFETWIAFYQDFFNFPEHLPVRCPADRQYAGDFNRR